MSKPEKIIPQQEEGNEVNVEDSVEMDSGYLRAYRLQIVTRMMMLMTTKLTIMAEDDAVADDNANDDDDDDGDYDDD